MADNKEKDINKSGSVFNSSDFKNATGQTTNKVEPKTTSQPVTPQQQTSQQNPQTSPLSQSRATVTPKDKNEIFFEKFERSKKDFAKEKRREKNEAKKSLSTRNKILGFESKLRDDNYFKKFWIGIIVVTVLLLAYACVVVGFLGPYFSNVDSGSKWVPAVNIYGGLTKTSIILSGIAICLMPLPYIFLLALWFVGVNNVHRSKVFVSSVLVVLSISAVLLILVVPLSSVVFNQVIGFRPIQ